MSTVAWLDTSAGEQRRVRELIALFEETESRDELGIGQIRDVLSDALFPGTSVLQTRARYFLLVSWAYQYAASKRVARDLNARAQLIERQLVEVLRKGDDEGVIGRVVGHGVKTLPSTMFWSGLRRFGILAQDRSPDQLTGVLTRLGDGVDELVDRRVGEWHPTVPHWPDGFPNTLEGGLSLKDDEAAWLRDRIVDACQGSLLAHLVAWERPPSASSAPWEDLACLAAPEPTVQMLRVAEGFSLIMNGAALLYNVLVAECYEAAGLTRITSPSQERLDAYEKWLNRLDNSRQLVRDWNPDVLWALVDDSGSRVSFTTRAFVEAWTSAVRNGSAADALTDPNHNLRALIANREQSIKRGQSRLTNARLLASWGGASGTRPLNFRWVQVRRIVTDIHEGLNRARA
jgi:uncharacterized protein DUF6361